MGCSHSKRHPTYSIPLDSDKKPEGETPAYRNPAFKEGLITHFKQDPKIKTIKDLYNKAFEQFADRPFLGMREKKGKDEYGSYKFKTYKEVQEISKHIGSAIVNLDLAPKVDEFKGSELKFIGIWAKNCEQWIELDIACSMYKLVSIPIYATLGPEIVKFILEQTNLTSIFCSNDHIKELIEGFSKKEYKSLKNIVAFDDITEDEKSKAKSAGITLYSFNDLIKNGKEKSQEPVEVKPEDLYTICYTSGTTGTPKGAMLSHGSQTSSIAAIHEREDLDIDENDVYFSYLPLAHCMERSGILFMISKGTQIGFSSGDKKKMADDIKELRPTIIFGVPKVFNAMYENIKKEIDKQGPAKAGFAKMAIGVKLLNLKTRGKYTHPVFDKLIFNKIREAMGGRLRYAASGAAPISPEILNYLRVVWCIPIVEGYGPTEGCAITFLNSPNDPTTGQVGGPMGCIEFKLVDQKEMKYTSKDEHPRGEVCFRGPCAFSGYYKQREKTEETLDKDGWVHTGDIGQINPDGSLTILDKMKSFFKLSQGEYVAGDKVEEAYGKSKYVKELFVYGDSSQSYLVAVVVPEKEEVEKLAKELKLDDESFEKLVEKKEFKEKLLEEMDNAAKEKKLNGFEKIKNIHLEQNSFKKNGLMTPTEKLKRNEAKEKFKDAIDGMYKEGALADRQ